MSIWKQNPNYSSNHRENIDQKPSNFSFTSLQIWWFLIKVFAMDIAEIWMLFVHKCSTTVFLELCQRNFDNFACFSDPIEIATLCWKLCLQSSFLTTASPAAFSLAFPRVWGQWLDIEKGTVPDICAYCSVGVAIIGFETKKVGKGSLHFAVSDELPRLNVWSSRLQEPVTF